MSNFSANIQAILDTSKFNKQIKELESKEYSINRFKLNTKGLPSQIQASLDGHNFTINITGIKTSNIESQMKSAGNKAGQSFSQSLVSRINSQISSGGIDAAVARVQQKFDTLKATINSMGSGSNQTALQNKLIAIGSELGHLKVLQDEFLRGGLAGTSLIDKYGDFQSTLSRVKNGLTEATSETKRFAKATDVVALQNKMESWLNKNTRATKTYGNTVQGFISKLQSLSAQGNVSSADLNELSDAFRRVDNAAESAGLKGKSFGSSIKGAFQSISRYVGVSTLIYAAFNAIKNGIKNIVDLDTALVDLQKTTDANEAQLREFYYTANETAKALGSTTKEVIQAAADWSRLGYSIKDAQTMAETSSIFASISPGMDISTATDGLVSAMKAFDIEAEDALDGIASKINAIGNTQAVDNQDIVNVLTRSSAAMKEANNTLEETIALGTAATEITRDAEAVGKQTLPTIKITISVKSQRWSRPRKDFVDIVTRQLGRACFLLYRKGVIHIAKERTYLLSVKCDNCGKTITQTRTQYNRAKHHYCSNKCQKEFQHKLTHETRKCLICNQEFEVSKRSTQTLCSVNCQKEWQKLQIGEKNPRYARQKAICEYCGKEIVVKKYKTENGQHLFCSTQCRRNWYSKVWSQQDDWKEESRIRAAKILESGAIGTDTKPQRIINEMLDEMKIKYVNEKAYKYFSVDNYLIEHNLIIEVMGDFWHCNPLKYIDNFHIIQKKRIPKDKAKHTYMRNNHNIEILYLWEDDIYNHPYLCRRLIREYIKSGGKLPNYHSFNYHIKNNKLLLNGNIILPYQDR